MIKLTKNQIMDSFLIVLRIDNFEEIGCMFVDSMPAGRRLGKYGNNEDVYIIADFDMAIVVGNNTFGNFELSNHELKKWNDKAYEILNQKGTTIGEKEKALYNLKFDFYKAVGKMYYKKLKDDKGVE